MKMGITYSIKVKKENVQELERLECMDSVTTHADGHVECTLKKSSTRGNTIVQKDDWIVRFENGEWQRFGSVAYIDMLSGCRRKRIF